MQGGLWGTGCHCGVQVPGDLWVRGCCGAQRVCARAHACDVYVRMRVQFVCAPCSTCRCTVRSVCTRAGVRGVFVHMYVPCVRMCTCVQHVVPSYVCVCGHAWALCTACRCMQCVSVHTYALCAVCVYVSMWWVQAARTCAACALMHACECTVYVHAACTYGLTCVQVVYCTACAHACKVCMCTTCAVFLRVLACSVFARVCTPAVCARVCTVYRCTTLQAMCACTCTVRTRRLCACAACKPTYATCMCLHSACTLYMCARVRAVGADTHTCVPRLCAASIRTFVAVYTYGRSTHCVYRCALCAPCAVCVYM